MQAGVLQFFSWPDRRIPLEQVYERALQRIEIMDQTGYEAVWLAEHHFSSFSVCPSIHQVGTFVAARTKNLRIGTGISLAPFYNPLRLAEEVALLDVLSNGRVNWGVGRGYQSGEFEAFGVDPDKSYEIFREHVEAVLGAWTQERLTFEGEYFHCRDLEVLPKPVQKPHPPVWLASSSPEAMHWAAQQGHSIMLDPHSTHQKIGEKRDYYRQVLEQHGHSIADRVLPMARLIAIGDSHEEAATLARQGAAWTVMSHRQEGVRPAKTTTPLNEELPDLSVLDLFEGDDAVDRYLNGVIVYGTAEEVVDEIQRLQEEISLEYLLAAPLSHGTFLKLTDEVLPKVM